MTYRQLLREEEISSGDVSGLRGDASGLSGDVSGLRGDASGLSGDASGLSGYVSGLSGDVSGLSGDVSEFQRFEGLDCWEPLEYLAIQMAEDAGEFDRCE